MYVTTSTDAVERPELPDEPDAGPEGPTLVNEAGTVTVRGCGGVLESVEEVGTVTVEASGEVAVLEEP